MLDPLDPLRGYFDRVLEEGDKDKINMLRNIYPVVMAEFGEPFDVKKHKERCIEAGYGSREAVNTLWPDEPSKEENGTRPS